jgi:hypothetical protein
MRRYLKQVLIAFDQLINALLGGWADESLSAHAWRQHLEGKRNWPYLLIDAILFFDGNHCRTSYESELERTQLPPSMKQGRGA